jgi:uncharacterized protein YaaQ
VAGEEAREMKMVMAVVPRDEVERVLQTLTLSGYTATYTDSRGGMLRQAQRTLFIAVPEEDVEEVLDIIRQRCRSAVSLQAECDQGTRVDSTALVGGAAVFVWDVERHETY